MVKVKVDVEDAAERLRELQDSEYNVVDVAEAGRFVPEGEANKNENLTALHYVIIYSYNYAQIPITQQFVFNS